ncbi:phenylacetyl-CoA ligase [Wolfiporia cocos MD-104 SS10]|uniref:Phenylacetyl-CoA ligase n=1 Tax=Wolfiporia cocos (strain MD-104) TaxID=742152 RepID=A0A2H3JDH6_WOLCO|nr:phenylacetyl-CoA ligase [Wolfiporia cocos MD-104 SS10]
MAEIQGPGGPLPFIPDDVTVPQFLLDSQHPSRPVVTNAGNVWLIEDSTGRKVGYEEIRARTHGLANALHLRWNIGENDVVCIFSPNHMDYPAMIWAIHRLGAIVTTANPAYTAEELVHQLRTTSAKLILVHPWNVDTALAAAQAVGIPPENIALVDPLPASASKGSGFITLPELVKQGSSQPTSFTERKLKPGEAKTKLAFLSFSSGTTGLPKAVSIPHYSLVANIVQVATFLNGDTSPPESRGFRPGDVVFAALPFYHAYGLAFIMHALLFYGYTLVVVPKFNFVDMLKSIERYRINFLPTVPPMFVLLCKHPDVPKYDLSSVRSILCGAAPLFGELMEQLSKKFPKIKIGQGFGMTESFTMVAMLALDQHVGTPNSAGVLLPGITARVVRADGSLAPHGEAGQFVFKSPALALGYYNNEKATKETFVDGWLYSGDEVTINEKGELFVLDRIKELLKVRGFQVAPAEIEGYLLEHPDVADACVVSILDDYHGDLPLAFIVPSASAQERIKQDPAEADAIKAKLIKYVADGKIYYKQLTAGVVFTDVIPKNPSGKMLRRLLRDRAREMWKNGQLSSGVKPKL